MSAHAEHPARYRARPPLVGRDRGPALLLSGLRLHFPPYLIAWPGAGLVRCCLACGLGFLLARRWALLLALLPLPGW